MAVTIKSLAEALAELLGLDESEVFAALLQKGISNYGQFLNYVYEIQRQDRTWKG